MMKQRITRFTAIILTVVFTVISMINIPKITYAENAFWPIQPATAAGSAVLIDADTGAVLYDKNSHTKAYPASITKIMTALLTIENCHLDEVVTFSKAAAGSVKSEDASIDTKTGEKYTVEQSLYALLLESANEVAYGLAEHVGGTLSIFVDLMNARAKELGALDTHFNNASGLSDPNHYTTAYDIAMIGRASFSNPQFLAIDSYTGTYALGPTNMTHGIRYITGTNQMFSGRQYYYPYCKGSKTGFTDESGYTLISYAEKDGMRLICVVMKETNINDRYTDTRTLFDYGFQNFKKISVSNDDLSALFDSSDYTYSTVYGKSNIKFSIEDAYVDLPESATLSDIELKLDNSDSTSMDLTNYTGKVNFSYHGNSVGSGTFQIHQISKQNTNLPYLKSEATIPVTKSAIVINVWYIAVGVSVIILLEILYYVISMLRIKRHRNYENES